MFDDTPAMTDYRYQWYQSQTQILLTVYAQHLDSERLRVNFTEMRVDLEILQREPAVLHFRIEKPIIPDRSKVTITPSKVEVKMMKAVPGTQGWSLYSDGAAREAPQSRNV
jgi:suppressor of G2 allele of SKP1